MRVAIIVTTVLAGSVAAVPAGAAELGIYAGVSYSMVEKDADRTPFANTAANVYRFIGFEPQSSTASIDTKDQAYGFVVGWRFSEHFAVEGGYLDLGDVQYKDHSDGQFIDPTDPSNPPIPGTVQQNIESGTSGIQVSGLAILPLSYRWELYARGGVLIANSTADVFVTNGQISDRASTNTSGFDLIAGAGISFSLVEIYSVRLEYGRVFDAGETDTLGAADVDMATLNVTVSF
jgi:OOP family OmpA-OmpF porin